MKNQTIVYRLQVWKRDESRNRRLSENTKIKINKIGSQNYWAFNSKGFCIWKLTGFENSAWWHFQTNVLCAKASLEEDKDAENTVSTQETIIDCCLTSHSTCESENGAEGWSFKESFVQELKIRRPIFFCNWWTTEAF